MTEERFEALLQGVEKRIELEPIVLDPLLAAPESNERGVQIRSYNWRAEQFEKISVMDTSVVVPPMHQLNSMFYPQANYDAPIFLFLTVITKSSVVTLFNACCPFQDDDYLATYIDPLLPILDRYPPFTGKLRDPDWFEKYRTPATVFGLFSNDEISAITKCGLELLDAYLRSVAAAKPTTDEKRLRVIEAFQAQFREDIRTKDVGRSVLEKLTDEETARRIFYEVAT